MISSMANKALNFLGADWWNDQKRIQVRSFLMQRTRE
jgi:hypothetical protein